MNIFWIAFAGASTGWMVGLANTPTVSAVLMPIVGLIATALAAMSSLKSEQKFIPKVESVVPIAVFLFFMAVTSTLGIVTRDNLLLLTEDSIELYSSGFNRNGLGGAFSDSASSANCGLLRTATASAAEPIIHSLNVSEAQKSVLRGAAEIGQNEFDTAIEAFCK